MSDEKQTFSAQELERLLNDLSPAAKTVADADIDRALEDILGRPASTGSVFEPVPQAVQTTAANEAGSAVPQSAVPASPAAQPSPFMDEEPASAQTDAGLQSIPFSADGEASGLKLDDNPLVNEDFRRFFTTSVTPDALFSSTTETGVPTRRGHTVTQLGLNRLKHERTAEQDEEEEEEEDVRPPREKGGFLAALRKFFFVEDEEEGTPSAVPAGERVQWSSALSDTEEENTEQAGSVSLFEERSEQEASPFIPAERPVVTAAPQSEGLFKQPEKTADNLFAEESAESSAEKIQEEPEKASVYAEEPVPEKVAGVDGGTVIFEKIAGASAAEEETTSTATTIFEPVQVAEPAAERDTAEFEPQHVPEQAATASLFDAVIPEEEATAAEKASKTTEAAEGETPLYERSVRAAEDDYTDEHRQEEIAGTLKAMTMTLTLRAAIVGVLAFNALYFGLAAVLPSLPQPAGLVTPDNAGMFTLVVYLVSLLLAGAVSWPVFKNGVPGLWQQPSADSLAAVSCMGALVQNLVLLVKAGSFEPEKQLVYTVPALLALFANTLGKRMLARGVQKNFERLGAANQTYAVAALVEDDSLVRRLTYGLGETEPCLLVSRPAAYLKGFVRRSFSDRPGEALAQRLSQGLVGAAALAGFLAIMLEGSFVDSMAGVLCLGCPLTMVLSAAVPAALMNKSAETIGTVIPGAQSVEELGQANVVVADAKDLFPGSCVQLKGLKVFSEPRIDLALLYAASLLVPNCPTLRGVFLDIIQDRMEILPEIRDLNVELGCGYEGWTDSRHLLVGNRGMMITHGVEVPPEDYELRYTREGRYCPVYLAVNGRLYAMFVLGYRADADVKEMLDEIYVSGLSLLVTSDDFNLTGERINTTYGIPTGCIKVLGAAESRQLAAHTAPRGGSEGAMAHATSFKGFIAGIRIAANAASMEKAAGILQAVSVILSALLVLVLTCTGGLGTLGLLTVLLYQLAWTVLILLLPLVKRY